MNITLYTVILRLQVQWWGLPNPILRKRNYFNFLCSKLEGMQKLWVQMLVAEGERLRLSHLVEFPLPNF